jgi:ABC-type sugar transport system ATPase subunit
MMVGPASAAPILSARDIRKHFSGTYALQGVDFDLRSGEIHALIGANGAGKSTLARILAGLQPLDGGTIHLGGQQVTFASPRAAMEAGVTLVTQETSLAPHLTALENIFLAELGRPGRLDWRGLRRRAAALIEDLNMDIGFSLDEEVSRLSMANRQVIEILKVLVLNSRVIFLDEPTTSLSPYECDRLLELSQRLAATGHGLVLVTHRMEEIFSFTDRMTVLREGRLVAKDVETRSIDTDQLIRLMVGRELQDVYSREERPSASDKPVVFRASGLAVGDMVKDVSFDVGQGEILGLGGLVGAGRTETVEAVFGLRPLLRGGMELFGRPYTPGSPKDAIKAGLGFVGEDRRRHGLVPDLDVRENLLLVHLSMQRGLLTNYGAVEREAASVAESLGLSASRLRDPDILKFSGGMQQKIIMARWLLARPRLLILDEPTRGVDIETRSSIYKALRTIAASGTAIVVVSSDFEELLGISDRIVVLSDGRSVADVPAGVLDMERLTMLAAPRSSAGQIGNLLTQLAERYRGGAVWVQGDDSRLFCFESAAHREFGPVLKRGTFVELSDPLAPREDRNWTVVPFGGRRGQSLGLIGVTTAGELPTPAELSDAVAEALRPAQAAAA